MRPKTHQALQNLRSKAGKEYGKLIQKLLAIALLETDVEALVERSIQGIDLDVRIAGRAYAFEVKTSEGDDISLARKDLDGLERQRREGAQAYIAMLPGGRLGEWIFARYNPGELATGRKLSSFQLRPYRDRELEQRVHSAFEAVVEQHVAVAASDGQSGLDRVLEQFPARALA
jgi:hypothetical protein